MTLTLFSIQCSDEKKVLEIPLTSVSEEAKVLLVNKIMNSKTGNQLFAPDLQSEIKKIINIDPSFHLANTFYARYLSVLGPEERRKIITAAYNNIDSVSNVEKAIISSVYNEFVLGNLIKGGAILEDALSENPNYYYLWLYAGVYQNFLVKNPKKSELSWEQALKIHPQNSRAKLLLSQLHFVTGQVTILSREDIDEEKAIYLIEDAEKTDAKNPVYSRLLGNIYRGRGEFDKSLVAYNKSMSLVQDKENAQYSGLLLISGHNYLFKKEFDKARELYRESTKYDIENNNYTVQVLTSRWLAHTYVHEKKYNEAIKEINDIENKINGFSDIDEIRKNNFLQQLDFERFISYGHSQMKEDAFESIQNFSDHLDKIKSLRIKNDSADDEIERITLNIDIQKEFHKIWYLILFGEFEEASKQLKPFSLLSSEYLVYDSKAMINFYKLSGYLNLMSGNVDASISFYNQIPREVLDSDNYQLYFYALALSTKGDKEKSQNIFKYLANYNFAGWENSIVRPIAQAQLVKT